MDKFVFDPAIPPLIQTELERQLAELEWLIPGWCQRVFVEWSSSDAEHATLIECLAMYEYRKVYLTFYPKFLSQGDRQTEDIIHDLLHCFSMVLMDYAEAQIKLLAPEETKPELRESILEELRTRHESFVQDLAYCLAKKLAQR